MQLGHLFTFKQGFTSLKTDLFGNSIQGGDIQKLCFQCLHPDVKTLEFF